MVRVQQCKEATKEELIADRMSGIVGPYSSSFLHIADIDRSDGGCALSFLVSVFVRHTGFSELGLKVICSICCL